MEKPKGRAISIVLGLGAGSIALWLLVIGPAFVAAEGGGPNSAWSDNFNGGQLNNKFWVVSNGSAPGAIANQHQG